MIKQFKDMFKECEVKNSIYMECSGEFGKIRTEPATLEVTGDCFMLKVTEDNIKGFLPLDKNKATIKNKKVIVKNNMNCMYFLSSCDIELEKVDGFWFLCGVWLFGSHQSVIVEHTNKGLLLSKDNGLLYC